MFFDPESRWHPHRLITHKKHKAKALICQVVATGLQGHGKFPKMGPHHSGKIPHCRRCKTDLSVSCPPLAICSCQVTHEVILEHPGVTQTQCKPSVNFSTGARINRHFYIIMYLYCLFSTASEQMHSSWTPCSVFGRPDSCHPSTIPCFNAMDQVKAWDSTATSLNVHQVGGKSCVVLSILQQTL